MARSRQVGLLLLALAVSLAVRLHNVWTYPSLRAFDGFGHFTYIWFMADHWRVPEPTAGWSFFHPPLYYWWMASVWTLLDQFDPVTRLRIGTSVTAALGLTQGLVAWWIARRFFPNRPVLPLLSAVLMLFLPVHLFTAGYLGNEGLNAVLCSLSLLTLLWVLRGPCAARGALLGLCLGAAMLTKFTSIAFVAASLGAIGLQTLVRRTWKTGIVTLSALVFVMVSVCGWFYARNVLEYGDPFKVSRDEFIVRRHENLQTTGERGILEYVLFDPLIIYRPQWPRGVPLSGELPEGASHSPLRESVWTGLFANAFFDAVGNQVLPAITHSEESRRAGQLMLLLGIVPSMLVVLGVATGLRRLWRDGWDDTMVAMLLTFGLAGLTFVQATRTVPMNAAVKATYMTPAAITFSFWFALGADALARFRPWLLRPLAAWCAVLATASVIVFTNGLFLARGWLNDAVWDSPIWRNIYGIVYYAAGDRDRAREMFEAGVATSWHLSSENLAAMAMEEGRPLEALYRLRVAARNQKSQSYGIPEDRATYDRITQAEYSNTMAVLYHRLGWKDLAVESATKAWQLDPTIPEVNYDLAALTLEGVLDGDRPRRDARAKAALAEGRRLLFAAAVADRGFAEPRALAGSALILEGKCEEGMAVVRDALAPDPDRHRFYPVDTGQGDIQAAAIHRRTHLAFDELPAVFHPDDPPAHCRSADTAEP